MSAIIDDNYLMGPPAAIFSANRTFAQDLEEVGLKLNPRKSKCYIACAHRDATWDELRGNILNGALVDESGEVVVEDGTLALGLTVCNVPVGTIPFVRGYLKKRKEKIVTGFDRIGHLLDPGR